MKVIATGKWSKDEKRWRMVVALRPAGRAMNSASTDAARRGGALRPPKPS